MQAAGWPDSFENVSKRLAEAAGGTPPRPLGRGADTVTVLWAGAERLWFTADDYGLIARFDGCVNDEAMLLELTDSHDFRIKGEAARQVLAKGVAVDLHTSFFRYKRSPAQGRTCRCAAPSRRTGTNFMYRAVMQRSSAMADGVLGQVGYEVEVMAFVTRDGVRLYYEDHGSGPAASYRTATRHQSDVARSSCGS